MRPVTLKRPLLHSAAVLAVSGIALSAGYAGAQEGGTPSESTALAPRTSVDTITVQATRRTQDQQSVAIAVTAVTGESLQRKFAQDLRDLSHAAPNVSLEPVGVFQNSSSFYIRGQGSSDIESAADPGVAILIDGVYQARISTGLQDFLDVEAVEILRGPQGTLFGRNTISGAVLMRHKAPDLEEFSIGGSVLVGNYGRLDVKGIVNIPIAENKVAARVAFKSTNSDGYYKNLTRPEGDQDVGATDRITILPSIRFSPNDNLDIVIRGEYGRTRDDSYPAINHNECRQDPFERRLFGGPNSLFNYTPQNPTNQLLVDFAHLALDGPFSPGAIASTYCGKPVSADDYNIRSFEGDGEGSDLDIWGITAEANYTMEDIGTFTFIGNYREVSEEIYMNIVDLPFSWFTPHRSQEHDQKSFELRFASDFSDKIDFVTGIYYFQQSYVLDQFTYGSLFEPTACDGNACTPVTFHPDAGTGTLGGNFGQAMQDHESWAAFAQFNYHITDKLTFTGGIRYTSENKQFEQCGVGSGDPLGMDCETVPFYVDYDGEFTEARGEFDADPTSPTFGSLLYDADAPAIVTDQRLFRTGKWKKWTPKFGLQYQATDDVMLFASWTRGFRSGGFNGRGNTESSLGPFGPENADSYEVGIKSDWFDNKLRVNLTAFLMKLEDLQRSVIRQSPIGGQETTTANAGAVETKGIELEFQAVPTEGLTLHGAVGYLNTKETDYCADLDGPQAGSGIGGETPPPPPLGFEQCNDPVRLVSPIDGGVSWIIPTQNAGVIPAARAPTWTISAGFAYEWTIGNAGYLTFAADWNYRSRMNLAGSTVGVDAVTHTLQYNGDHLPKQRRAVSLINASLGFADMDGRYRVSLFVKNLTKETYVQSITPVASLWNFRAINAPRTWGLEVSFDL